MELSTLNINNFRNLNAVQIEPVNTFNFFSGDNGAGKTSILEAVHFLSHGRSFRNVGVKPLINDQAKSFIIKADINGDSDLVKHVGIEKSEKVFKGRINGIEAFRISQFSELLPVITIHPGSFGLLTETPSSRRAFLDWGLFFSDPRFKSEWQKYHVALRQRNAGLRAQLPKRDIHCWNVQLVEHGEYLSQARDRYLTQIQQIIPDICHQLESQLEIKSIYRTGWSKGMSLADSLVAQVERDLSLGYTYSGPHRADFSISFNNKGVAKFASRGQIKLITVLLKLAQAYYFVKQSKTTCVLLLDDIASELDEKYLSLAMRVVADLKLQVFLTSVSSGAYNKLDFHSSAMFHVEHGVVDRVL